MRKLCAAFLFALAAFGQAPEWRPLTGNWRATPFRGAGKVQIAGGVVQLAPGGPMTGVTWNSEFPKTDYEIRFEARRMQGNDFFASLTFPVGQSSCTWVMGGWGGDIVGLSSIDGWDASDNETRNYFTFENGRWYTMRLRVSSSRITAWIDEKQTIDAEIAGRTIALRPGEIKLNVPLGFASYNTAAEIRRIEFKK